MAPTCIDIVVNKNVINVTNPTSLPELSSDHNPIVLELQNQEKETYQKTIISYRDTDWTEFRNTLNQNIKINNKIESTDDIDRELNLFTDHVVKAQLAHSKKIKIGQKLIQIDDETKNLIRIRNRTRKLYQQTYWQYLKQNINQLNRAIRKKIREHLNLNWEKTLKDIKPGDRTLWRITKAFKNDYVQIPTLTKDDINYFTDKEKSELIGKN